MQAVKEPPGHAEGVGAGGVGAGGVGAGVGAGGGVGGVGGVGAGAGAGGGGPVPQIFDTPLIHFQPPAASQPTDHVITPPVAMSAGDAVYLALMVSPSLSHA